MGATVSRIRPLRIPPPRKSPPHDGHSSPQLLDGFHPSLSRPARMGVTRGRIITPLNTGELVRPASPMNNTSLLSRTTVTVHELLSEGFKIVIGHVRHQFHGPSGPSVKRVFYTSNCTDLKVLHQLCQIIRQACQLTATTGQDDILPKTFLILRIESCDQADNSFNDRWQNAFTGDFQLFTYILRV